jgi:Uma2 family endonuclease
METRHELVDGEIVAMAPERVRHNLIKASVYRALDDAIRVAKLPCTAFTDGVGVVIDKWTTRIPDASVQCGLEVDLDAMILEAPLIVVEVASPSSERNDLGAKFVEYFSVSSVRHCIIVVPEKGAVVHHRRSEGEDITTHILRDGVLVLEPPGLSIRVAELLGPAAGPDEASR